MTTLADPPVVGWRGEIPPRLPFFDDTVSISRITSAIRAGLERHLCVHLPLAAAAAKRDGLGHAHNRALLPALYSRRYGVIYWQPSRSAGQLLQRLPRTGGAFDETADWLDRSGWTGRLFNAAVAGFLSEGKCWVWLADDFVPENGFQPLGPRDVAIRREDRRTAAEARDIITHLYDLHDFAHLAATRLAPGIYGNKLHASMHRLPRPLVNLVAGFKAPRLPEYADGRLFSDLLTPMYNRGDWAGAEEDSVVTQLAEPLADYLLGARPLFDARLDALRYPSRAVTAAELAVLAQNKAYELPASEIEQFLFVRGGADGRDPFEHLAAGDRIRAFAALNCRAFHEARNTLKHRAHTRAYAIVARRLLTAGQASGGERELLSLTADKLCFTRSAGIDP